MMNGILEFSKFILRILKRIIIPSTSRFIRLSPNHVGKIHFYDRKFKKFFSVESRGYIDSITADQIYSFNDYDISFLARAEEINQRYQHLVNNGITPLIIDCGANIGLSARYLSEEFPESQIIAIEPDLSNMELAKINCNQYKNIDFLQGAIGSIEGFFQIDNPDVDPNSFKVSRSNPDNNSSKIFSINSLLNEYTFSKLFIVKVDIEGFEDDLFSKNTNWIDDCYLLIIELHDWMLPNSANSKNFLKAISSRDRDFVYKEENIFSIMNTHH